MSVDTKLGKLLREAKLDLQHPRPSWHGCVSGSPQGGGVALKHKVPLGGHALGRQGTSRYK